MWGWWLDSLDEPVFGVVNSDQLSGGFRGGSGLGFLAYIRLHNAAWVQLSSWEW